MKIKSLYIQNFLSIKDAYIDFTKFDGLTLIKGKNLDTGGSNGSGKSSIVEAVYFSLTGKTIRKSTEASLVNTQSKKGLVVEVKIEQKDGSCISIRRGKKPTHMRVLVDGEDITEGHSKISQELLDELIGAPYKVLAASMFFGQSNDLNFLDASPTVKREIIRNFLNLDDIFMMRDAIRDYKSDFSNQAKAFDTIITQFNKDISSLDTKIKNSNSDISVDLETLKGDWNEYNKLFTQYKYTEDLIEKEKSIIYTFQSRVDNPKCLTCGADISVESAKEEVQRHKKLLRSYEEELGGIDILPKPNYTVDYATACQENVSILYSLKREKLDDIEVSQKAKAEYILQYEVMRFWEKALSEKGVIKYVIRNILSYFNERIKYYLSYLTDHTYSLKFDDELSELITIGNNIIPYISLSGGEKRKINLAVMMALKDLLLLTDTNHSDLLFFDEIAENIDEEGIRGLYNLLLELKKSRQIFVITHNKHLKSLLDSSKRLVLEKRKGVSTIWHK